MKNMINGKTVVRVYFGKAGHCCCGCSGKYHETPAMITRAVNRILAVQSCKAEADDYMEDPEFVSIECDGRMITAYFVK